jgi:hypothetical protein
VNEKLSLSVNPNYGISQKEHYINFMKNEIVLKPAKPVNFEIKDLILKKIAQK